MGDVFSCGCARNYFLLEETEVIVTLAWQLAAPRGAKSVNLNF